MTLTTPLRNCDPTGINATLSSPISPDGRPEPGVTYEIPPRQGRAARLRSGEALRVTNVHGTQVCDTWAFSAANMEEFMSWEHGRAWIDAIAPRPGDALVTNRRRPILTLVADTSPGVHDTLMAACDWDRYRTLGCRDYHDNCADNLRLALMAIGLVAPHVPQPLNLWMNIPVAADGRVSWLPPVAAAGDHVLLRAEMDCVVVMSACPQDIVPINGAERRPTSVSFVLEPS